MFLDFIPYFPNTIPKPFIKRENLDSSKLKGFADDKLNVIKKKIKICFGMDMKHCWKEKMWLTSISSFSFHVFKMLPL